MEKFIDKNESIYDFFTPPLIYLIEEIKHDSGVVEEEEKEPFVKIVSFDKKLTGFD